MVATAVRVIRVLAVVALLAVLLGPSDGASGQSCNHHDGNVELSVNYNAVGYGVISVCNMSANIDGQAVQHAMQAWNDMVGKPLLTNDCRAPTGVWITDVESGSCGDVACADRPWQETPLLLGIYVEPAAHGWSLDCQKSLIVHEMGHNLGFSHWPVCNSVMHATLCDCDFLEPAGPRQDRRHPLADRVVVGHVHGDHFERLFCPGSGPSAGPEYLIPPPGEVSGACLRDP